MKYCNSTVTITEMMQNFEVIYDKCNACRIYTQVISSSQKYNKQITARHDYKCNQQDCTLHELCLDLLVFLLISVADRCHLQEIILHWFLLPTHGTGYLFHLINKLTFVHVTSPTTRYFCLKNTAGWLLHLTAHKAGLKEGKHQISPIL
jgi:hypothetical protein